MAQNSHRSLAGFICGFSLGKLSTVLKWYSVKRKKKKNLPTNLKCCVCRFSSLGLMHQSRNCWRKKSCWTILPIPPCNLGIVCVTRHGNLSIWEYSGWKESSNLRKPGLFWTNISNAKKRFFSADVCPQSLLLWPRNSRRHLSHW